MKFWKKLNGLKTWQWSLVGALTGLAITIFLVITLFLFGAWVDNFNAPYVASSLLDILLVILILPTTLILILVFGIFELLPSDPWDPEGIATLAMFLSPIFYTVIGALVGYFIGKLKNQKKVKSKHK